MVGCSRAWIAVQQGSYVHASTHTQMLVALLPSLAKHTAQKIIIIPPSLQLAAAGSLEKTLAPPSVAVLATSRGRGGACLVHRRASCRWVWVSRLQCIALLLFIAYTAIRKHEGVPSSHRRRGAWPVDHGCDSATLQVRFIK